MNKELFFKNLSLAQANPNFVLSRSVEQLAEIARSTLSVEEESNNWLANPDKVISLANIVPRGDKHLQDLLSVIQAHPSRADETYDIKSLVDVHHDLHYFKSVVSVREIVES